MQTLLTCRRCKKAPVLLTSEAVTCLTCRMTAQSAEHWNEFNKRAKKKDIDALIEELQTPVQTLKAVCVWTDDTGLRALVTTSLKRLNALEFKEFFENETLALEFQKAMEKSLGK